MKGEVYNNLIRKTFLDGAIRSVLMIDDDYIDYYSLIDHCLNKQDLKDEQKDASIKAASLQKYFSKKRLICDISDGADDFEPQRARKSDLIILDYQLEASSPVKTLKILSQLSQSPHMNLVVIYTNENLDKAWLQSMASMRGGFKSELNKIPEDEEFSDIWDESTENGTELPEEWRATSEELAEYLIKGKNQRAFTKQVGSSLDAVQKKYSTKIANAAVNFQLRPYCLLDQAELSVAGNIAGNFSEDSRWLLLGNVFIAFHSKKEQEPPEKLFETLEIALVNWQPNFFRLMISEIQNHVENDGLVFEKYIQEEYVTQAAWLWWLLLGAKAGDAKDRIHQFLSNEVGSNFDNVLLNDNIVEFGVDLLQVFEDFPDCCDESQREYLRTHVSKELAKKSSSADHLIKSLNHSFAFRSDLPSYVTNGLLLSSKDEKSWFLCVSPACDTVPNQHTNSQSKKLSPYRMLKFLELQKAKLENCLEIAHRGKFLFLKGKSFALEVGESVDIHYAISHGHDSNENESDSYWLTFFDSSKSGIKQSEIEVLPIGLLKDSYAARFQAIASSHVGRIGVDFVTTKNFIN